MYLEFKSQEMFPWRLASLIEIKKKTLHYTIFCLSNSCPVLGPVRKKKKKKKRKRNFKCCVCKNSSKLYFMASKYILTHVLLNKLRCHTYFQFTANQITSSGFLLKICIPNGKQCRSRSIGFFRSQLIWIYTVWKGRVYPGSAGQGLSKVYASNQNLFLIFQPSLTLILLNPSMPCLCQQCRSGSVGFITDLDLCCLPVSLWLYINNLDQVIWLAKN